MSPVLSVTPTFIMSPDLPIMPTYTTALPSLAVLPTFIISPDLPIMPTAVFPALGLTSAPSASSAAIPAATPSDFGDGFKGPRNINVVFFACLFGALILGAAVVAATLGWSRYKARKARDAAPKDEEAQGGCSGNVETQTGIPVGTKDLDDNDEKLSNGCDAEYIEHALQNIPQLKNEEKSSQTDELEHEDSELSYDSKRITILAGLDISFSDASDSDSDVRTSAASLFSEDDRTSITTFASDSKRLSGSNWAAVQSVVSQRASFVQSATYTVEDSGSHAEGFQAEIVVHDITTCRVGQPQTLQSIPEADIAEEGSTHMEADSEYNIDVVGMEGLVADVVGDRLQPRPRAAMPSVISTNRPRNTTTDFGEDARSQLDKLVASLRGAKEEDFVLTFDDGESFEFPLPPMHIPILNKAQAAGNTLPPSSCAPFGASQTSVTVGSEYTVNNTSSPPSVAFSHAHRNTPSLSQDHTISTTDSITRLDCPLSMDLSVILNPNPPQKYAADFEAWCRDRDAARAATKADPHSHNDDKIDDFHAEDAVGTCASDYSISALSEGQTEGIPPPISSSLITDVTEREQFTGRSQVGVPSTTGRRELSFDTDEIKAAPSPTKTEPEKIIPAMWQSHIVERPKASKPKHTSTIPRGTLRAHKNTTTPSGPPATARHAAPNKGSTGTQGTVKPESKPTRSLRPSRSLAIVAPRPSPGNVELRMQQSGGRAVPVAGNALARQTLGGRPKPALPSVQSSTVRAGPIPSTPKRAPLATTSVRGGTGTMKLASKTISSGPRSSAHHDRALKSADTNVTTGPMTPRVTLALKDSSAPATIPKAKFFKNLATPAHHTLVGNQKVSPLRTEPALPKLSASLSKSALTRSKTRKRDWTN